MKTDQKIAALAEELATSVDPRDRVISARLMSLAGAYCAGGSVLFAASDFLQAQTKAFLSEESARVH